MEKNDNNVRLGLTKSCGCLLNEMRRKKQSYSLKPSRLTFIRDTGRVNGYRYGLYLCRCGVEKEIRKSFVNTRETVSCGCLLKEHRQSVSQDAVGWRVRMKREEEQLRALKRGSREAAEKAGLREMYPPMNQWARMEGDDWVTWLRNEKARIQNSGRTAELVWASGTVVSLWVSP